MILFLGSGFIGNALSAHLQKVDISHRIVSQDIAEPSAERIRRKIDDIKEIDALFDGIDTVIYLAHGSVPFSSMQNILGDAEQNILSAIRIFEILAKKGIRVIYISSGGSVYGNQQDLISERSLPSPISAYGVSKLTIENYLKLYHHNYKLPYDILRLSNIYGIGQNNNKPQGIVCAIADAFVNNHKIKVWGDGGAKKDYLYIDDLIDALAKVAAKPASNETYNISYGESVSVTEIISLFENAFGYSIDIEKTPALTFDVQQVLLDNSKFISDYDWKPKVDIKSGVEKTIEWLKNIQ